MLVILIECNFTNRSRNNKKEQYLYYSRMIGGTIKISKHQTEDSD